jgi:IS30 family transposase
MEGKKHKGFIPVVTERVSGQMMMTYLPKGKNAKVVAQAIIALLLPYKEMVLSITVDNGTEFAEHEKVSKALNCQIYFTHPYCSWEKGQVENTNGLIRQYCPKKEIIDELNTKNIKQIQYKINRRPRKNLEFKRPVEIFYKFVNDKVAFAG